MNIPDYQGAANTTNTEYKEVGGDKWIKVYNHGSALTVGYVYAISTKVDATDTSNPIFYRIPVTPATLGTASAILGVAENAIAQYTYGWLKIAGKTTAYVNGTTNDVAYGDQIAALNGQNYFVRAVAASSGVSAQLGVTTAAIALEAQAADSSVLTDIVLVGQQCGVAAATA